MEPESIRERPPGRSRGADPTPTEKPSASVFDRILEQSRMMQQAPLTQQQSSRHGSDDVQREACREGRRPRQRGPRAERERAMGSTKHDHVRTEKEGEGARHRIVVKAQLRRDQGGGGQGGRGEDTGQGGAGQRSKDRVAHRLRSELKTTIAGEWGRQFGDRLKTPKAATAFTTQQMQRFVNQLVQYIRVGRTMVGADELQLGMQETVFHGLRLRLTAKNGKVTVQFESAHADVQALFRKESARIRDALMVRGIAVQAVIVSS